MSATSSSWPLLLIALALSGAGISYHFTLNTRFSAIEQKLEQNALALQQFQIAQETAVSAKTDALNKLTQEVDTLQTSLTPLGKATKEQTESLNEIRKQVASLDDLQKAQQEAQKKLADYAGQLEKIKHDVQAQTSAPVQPAPAPAPVPAPAPFVTPPAAAPAHASTVENRPPPLPPHTDQAVDLRPAEITAAAPAPLRALPVARATPVALPLAPALSDNR